jgi:hypothetical protein
MQMKALVLAAAMIAPAAIVAQDTHEVGVYKVDFTMHDSTDTAAKNGRKYSMLINGRNKAVMKVGNRVPAVTGGSGGIGQVNTQFTYLDVGVNIDCTVDERNGKYMLHADMDLSTVIPADKAGTGVPNPTISQIKINMDTTVTPGKPTLVASFDDPGTSRRFDVDVTMTKM